MNALEKYEMGVGVGHTWHARERWEIRKKR